MNKEEEALRATELLKGCIVSKIMLPRDNDVCIQFENGTRFFITFDKNKVIDLSITGVIDE